MTPDRVAVQRHDVVAIHVNFDMPEPLLAALRDAGRNETTNGQQTATEIVVSIGGNRIGTVKPYARQWRRLTEQEVERY